MVSLSWGKQDNSNDHALHSSLMSPDLQNPLGDQ